MAKSSDLTKAASDVYESYWRFASERQAVYLSRILQHPSPWTSDPVLSEFRFTNTFRATDRVSQYLIRHVIYRADLPRSPKEVIFRILLFKIFNKIETWKSLQQHFGAITVEDFNPAKYAKVLSKVMARGGTIYSAAYIMPPPQLGYERKHRNHLSLLSQMLKDCVAERICDERSLEGVYTILRRYPGIGSFLAYQFAIDINYSDVLACSEADFVVPGPGALDGIRKCFPSISRDNASDLIRRVADNQEEECALRGLMCPSLWGRRLQLIDCQNLFCEVDKYARVVHPNIAGRSGRTRIKQRFTAAGVVDRPWFPPKWGLNTSIDAWFGASVASG